MSNQADSAGYVARTGRRVADSAQRSLELLDVIERTLGALVSDTDSMRSDAALCATLAERLSALSADEVVTDPAGRACDALSSAAGALERVYRSLAEKRQAAINAPSLDAEDGVVEAFENAMDACRDLHDKVQELKDVFEEALADSEPVVASYGTAEEMIEALHKG